MKLRNVTELTINIVGKGPVIFKVVFIKIFEYNLRHLVFSFRVTIMLMSLLNYCSMEKLGGKKNLIRPINLSSFKIILILLAKTIIVQI